MPFNCDVCGDECSYAIPIVNCRNGAQIVVCRPCFTKIDKVSTAKGG